ncbi:hypothetical protein GCM10023082_58660 [Streptomyces tremellae]|uniref:Uncharacterized protein n=1 Tax=Streptomyces tremellae TaxID=1124239 RepID=A0ABP7G5L0_9ACTN
MISARRVTSERAARLGAYPVAATACRTVCWIAGSTLRIPFTTRETVARDTPAARATSSSVGPPDEPPGSLLMEPNSTGESAHRQPAGPPQAVGDGA